jgi:hypothetical protein
MRKSLFAFVLIASGVLFAFVPPKDRNIGRWKAKYGNDMRGIVEFKADGTFETSFENSDFKVGGIYITRDDVLYIADTSCKENYWGKYRQIFFSDDSVLNNVLEDSCSGRRASADKAVLIRMN